MSSANILSFDIKFILVWVLLSGIIENKSECLDITICTSSEGSQGSLSNDGNLQSGLHRHWLCRCVPLLPGTLPATLDLSQLLLFLA